MPSNFVTRGFGLGFRKSLPAGRGMLIHTNGIHMLFMRFAIDVVFLDAQNRVRAVRQRVRPWIGMVPFVPGAKTVVELPAGTLDGLELETGEPLELEPALVA